jgi:hypothetical protein
MFWLVQQPCKSYGEVLHHCFIEARRKSRSRVILQKLRNSVTSRTEVSL